MYCVYNVTDFAYCIPWREGLILSAGGFIRSLAILHFYNVTQLSHIIGQPIIIFSIFINNLLLYISFASKDQLQTTSCFYEVGQVME